MVIKQNVYSQKLSEIKLQKKCYCLCLLVRHDKFIFWLDMINSCHLYCWNDLKVVNTIKYAIYF